MVGAPVEQLAIELPLRFQRGEMLAHAEFSASAAAALKAASGPDALVRSLVADGDARDLVEALAFVLPKRQAVWWACLAARLDALGEQPTPAAEEALSAAEAWMPTGAESAREAAGAAAERCEFEGSAAWAAAAAFWSGGSIAPPDLPAVPPPSHLTPVAVRAALLMAARPESGITIEDLCAIGLDLIAGGDGRRVAERVATRAAPAEA